jgi:hypothetical protein
MKKIITRRDFMRNSTIAVLGTAMGMTTTNADPIHNKSRVILIRNENALDENFTFNQSIIQDMLDEAVTALFNRKNAVDSFKSLFKPTDVVGIKSNEWSYLPTPPELEKAIKRRVMDAGVNEKNIAVDDRQVRKNPIFQKSTALINVRPLRTHYLAGISGCMKNNITFAEYWPAYHPNNCANLGNLLNLPMVKGKTRLFVLCALTPQYHGRGPHHFNRRYVWAYKGLIVGTDPVAVDALGLKLIMAKRREKFGPRYRLPAVPRHIETADVKLKLGNSKFSNIDVVKLGWQDDILV